jgi:RNA polymerase subunit RPABC4/transcription elongation factor Spt4
MRNVKMLRTEPNFVSIPAEMAIYCENCENVSNSTRRRCGVCGSEAIFSLTTLIDGCIVPILHFETARAA